MRFFGLIRIVRGRVCKCDCLCIVGCLFLCQRYLWGQQLGENNQHLNGTCVQSSNNQPEQTEGGIFLRDLLYYGMEMINISRFYSRM